jgi:DNA helicase-2/ATP-dependent DNA helicase PcrA
MDFTARYKALNRRQREAVDQVDGPLMVIAGPGTGKTELLSLRIANILKRTDTLPENILCLTFTESGATAMRERLAEIIGPAAYKVAIHTFHSFGTEVINQNRQFFYNGASFRPADELGRFEILRAIFQELDPTNPLASKMNGAYTHLNDTLTVISELKSSGLTNAELLAVLDTNEEIIERAEAALVPIFAVGIKKGTVDALLPAVSAIRKIGTKPTVPGITSLAEVLAASLEQAVLQAQADNSTKPVTAWRSAWFKKDDHGGYILKSRDRQAKLRAASTVYDQYTVRMQEAGLFDFDDMILTVIHAMEVMPELRFNLQEKYLYVMVDEFQDTNLAQMRILLNLTDNEVNEGRPNIMVVGDDDQAIYGFQGATVGNIHSFIEKFPDAPRVVLTDNYRSAADILARSREVITQGVDRLENYMPGINKTLTAHRNTTSSRSAAVTSKHLQPELVEAPGPSPESGAKPFVSDGSRKGEQENTVRLVELSSGTDERAWVVKDIVHRIKSGEEPDSIAVLARRHHELVDLLPYFAEADLRVNYERRDNVLELESIKLIEQFASLLVAILEEHHDVANSLLPELLAHPAFAIDPLLIWKLSLSAQSSRKTWFEAMPGIPELTPLHSWLIANAQAAAYMPLERMIDILLGTPEAQKEVAGFVSPFYNYFFSAEKLENEPDAYLTHLEGLITIRAKLRDYQPGTVPTIRTFLDFLRLQRESGSTITSIRPASRQERDAIHLMTAHKAKGLEFDTVYIVGAVDSAWGERVRSRSRLIGYPENLPLQPAGDTFDDRLRLFYVAMTRAREQLVISYGTSDDSGKSQLRASFLAGDAWRSETPPENSDLKNQVRAAELRWYQPLISPLRPSMRDLLAGKLENYKLSATHLNNFLDVTRGGPQAFLVNDLLKFPQAVSPSAGYGRAIHTALQRAHAHLAATGEQRPHEDILKDFEIALTEQYLHPKHFELYLQKGSVALSAFLNARYDSFSPKQKTELNFGGQGVIVGEASLTGILDVVEISERSLTITDYKTGKSLHRWQGTTDYEKIKLHRYRQQLLFYELLIRRSRDYAKYDIEKGIIQFVEPTKSGDIVSLEASFTNEECERLERLIQAVWQHITTLDLPDTSEFEPSYKGVLAFEDFLLDELE